MKITAAVIKRKFLATKCMINFGEWFLLPGDFIFYASGFMAAYNVGDFYGTAAFSTRSQEASNLDFQSEIARGEWLSTFH